jgi:hypothetical protein
VESAPAAPVEKVTKEVAQISHAVLLWKRQALPQGFLVS